VQLHAVALRLALYDQRPAIVEVVAGDRPAIIEVVAGDRPATEGEAVAGDRPATHLTVGLPAITRNQENIHRIIPDRFR
jgi:hypothetical protein